LSSLSYLDSSSTIHHHHHHYPHHQYFTLFLSLSNVLQVTCQKIQGSLPHNIGTYSHRYGEKILPPYVIVFKAIVQRKKESKILMMRIMVVMMMNC